MPRLVALALVALLAPACAEKLTVTGPRPVGADVSVRLEGGAAELTIKSTYEAPNPRALTLTTTMEATGEASIGEITGEVTLEGLEVVEGQVKYTARPSAAAPVTEVLRLAPLRGVDRPVVKIRHLRGDQEVAATELRLVASDAELRACRAGDERCS
ncbi:MAG: hypothetical protein R3B09_30675 [Nannocystaceae bacterium]